MGFKTLHLEGFTIYWAGSSVPITTAKSDTHFFNVMVKFITT
jgi:hypothetical protein